MTSDTLLERFHHLHPKLIDLSLGRIERLLAALDHPERRLPPVIHVAGTNGKGSVIAFMRALLEAHGKKVQVLTSPHLVRFHERIRLSDGLISEDRLVDVLSRCEAANAGQGITYFEMTTAAALLACAEDAADWCLVEVGLGGRYDATNVIDRPAACVITPIGLDHQHFLGDTLRQIAFEKAGILKPGVPAFVAQQRPEAMAEIERVAAEVGAPLHVSVPRGNLPPLSLYGPHQTGNASLALDALEGAGVELDTAAVARGLASAQWPARMQRIDRGPLFSLLPEGTALWLDGGHNPDAARVIAASFAGQRLDLVVGLMVNKDAEGFLAGLAPIAGSVATVPIPGEDCHDPADLAAVARRLGLDAGPCLDVAAALREATASTVLICGSLYLAGSVLRDSGLIPQ